MRLQSGPAIILCLLTSLSGQSQAPGGLVVSKSRLEFEMVHTGPLTHAQSFSINAPPAAAKAVEWTAAADPSSPWVYISPAKGTTPATVKVGLVDWRSTSQAPGVYQGAVQFSTPGLPPTKVTVSWKVLPQAPGPKISYPSGPTGCESAAGYPDPPLCTVPAGGPSLFAPGMQFTDPNFGAKVRVLTGEGVRHTYSSPSPLSANNRYLMTYLSNGTYDIVEMATLKTLRRNVAGRDFLWDAADENIYYNLHESSILRHEVRSGKQKTLINYSKAAVPFRSILRGGTGDSSKDNWIAFFAPGEQHVCAADLAGVRTFCASYAKAPGPPLGDIDFALISKGVDKESGKRYVVLIAKYSPPVIYTVNEAAGALELLTRGPEHPESAGNHDGNCDAGEKCMYPGHTDTFEDSTGTQYLVFAPFRNHPCEVAVATYQLNKGKALLEPVEMGGGRKRVFSLWRCPFPPGTDLHLGCAKKAPYCVISTVTPGINQGVIPVRFPHAAEILVMRENGVEIRRLATSRSQRFREEGGSTYWSTPRAAISSDGSLVISDSNFLTPNAVRVTAIETGFGQGR